ncbi:hypothetical protein C2E23DRAFT_879803 [Lenzites betulinus]|nr:hypothetical protein C2E23DRAFT_879803 [Lenzites betulinus]
MVVMWRRYLGEFSAVSTHPWCVGKPRQNAFKRYPSRMIRSSRSAAIASAAPRVPCRLPPAPLRRVRVRSTCSPLRPHSDRSIPRNAARNDPLLLINITIFSSPYLLDPWTVRCLSCAFSPSLPRLAEAFSCFLLASAAQDSPLYPPPGNASYYGL